MIRDRQGIIKLLKTLGKGETYRKNNKLNDANWSF